MKLNKRRDLRLLFNTNSVFSNSGYAVEMRDILYRLVQDGWPLAVSGFYGVQGGPTDIPYPEDLNPKLKGVKIKHYPQMGDGFGSDAMFYHSMDFKAHAAFCMQDIWTLDPAFLSKMRVWIPWLPIDKDPLPPNTIEKLRYAYKIMSFSKFGHDLLEKNGFVSTLILEGTDTEIFTPMDQGEARKKMNLPQDAFFFTMIAANKENPPRKGFQEALEGFKLFHEKHPEAALLIHSQQRGPGGFPIREFGEHLKIAGRMFFVDDYLSMYNSGSNIVHTEYCASDALLHPSQTEGFGLCLIEAQSCGIPAIIQKCQSMPELIIEGKTGFGCETAYKRFTQDLSYVNVADPKSIYDCMEKTYDLVKKDKKKVAEDCRKWVVENYNIETIVNTKWIPMLCELQEELLPDPAKRSGIKIS